MSIKTAEYTVTIETEVALITTIVLDDEGVSGEEIISEALFKLQNDGITIEPESILRKEVKLTGYY